MTLHVLVPLKRLAAGKSRLAKALDAAERAALILTMLRHVVGTVVATGLAERIVLVGPEPPPDDLDIDHFDDGGRGLNESIEGALAVAHAAGADRALVLHADLPLLTPSDVARLAGAADTHAVAIAPDHRGTGTNAVGLTLPSAFRFAFGQDSLALHLATARANGCEYTVVDGLGLAQDIDWPDDLAHATPTVLAARLAAEVERHGRIEKSELVDSLCDAPLSVLTPLARSMTIAGHDQHVSYSRKVFIPLTRLCRDVCHYCTFAATPSRVEAPYLTIDEVVAIAEAGRAQGCREALFTLGDQPEARYEVARAWLDAKGYASTLDYLEAAGRAVVERTGLLPHLNPGLMDGTAIARLRRWSISMGLMLESSAARLCERGGPHHGSPDKEPARRLATIRAAGEARVPFTTGLLIGIGETRAERIDALLAIRALDDEHRHIQEVIIQNFRAKPGTRMADAPEPDLDEHIWTIAVARLLLGSAMSLQAPPNLRKGALEGLVEAGINDWGGVSPVTPDHVNPEAPWPNLERLAIETGLAGRVLTERTAIGPRFARNSEHWVDPAMRLRLLAHIDGAGLAREDGWTAGAANPAPAIARAVTRPTRAIAELLDRRSFDEAAITALFDARGGDVAAVVTEADRRRADQVGETVTYVVNRNINYTNICLYKCGFCGFSKGSTRAMRGPAYLIGEEEIARRTVEARDRGATEVCLQGGIHPDFDGNTYLGIVRAVKAAVPDMHVHAFSPLEIQHGARTLGLALADYLAMLRDAGLSTLPGTAAEILDDEVRAIICPDKLSTAEWLEVMETAHRLGLRSTATIMFGHVDSYAHWARHVLRVRRLQERTGGFTEFVPLPFVHMEAPIGRKGLARPGPTLREAVLMHAVARLALGDVLPNIQLSWPKLGPDAAVSCLRAGANDLGGVLMDESITRSAGGANGQAMAVEQLRELAAAAGRPAMQRTTLYGRPRMTVG